MQSARLSAFSFRLVVEAQGCGRRVHLQGRTGPLVNLGLGVTDHWAWRSGAYAIYCSRRMPALLRLRFISPLSFRGLSDHPRPDGYSADHSSEANWGRMYRSLKCIKPFREASQNSCEQ